MAIIVGMWLVPHAGSQQLQPHFRVEIETNYQDWGNSWRGHCDASIWNLPYGIRDNIYEQPLANNGLKAKIG